jgi:hypothetical protein
MVFGWLPVVASWFVVASIKGMPVGDGFVLSTMLLRLVFGCVFGLGIAIIFRFGRDLLGNRQAGATTPG